MKDFESPKNIDEVIDHFAKGNHFADAACLQYMAKLIKQQQAQLIGIDTWIDQHDGYDD